MIAGIGQDAKITSQIRPFRWDLPFPKNALKIRQRRLDVCDKPLQFGRGRRHIFRDGGCISGGTPLPPFWVKVFILSNLLAKYSI